MIPADNETEEQLIQLLKASSQSLTNFHGYTDLDEFDQVVEQAIRRFGRRPWLMKIFLYYFRWLAHVHEKKLINVEPSDPSLLDSQIEKVIRYKFAAIFGKPANSDERAWTFEQLSKFRVDFFDAPFLVWSRTINFKMRRIYYGHWDWIMGIISMGPVYLLIIGVICTCMCGCMPPFEKATRATVYLAEIIFAFDIYKAQSFDVFKVGSKYFKPDGLRLSPIPQ